MKYLTFKTLFHLALVSCKCRGEIHAWLNENIRHQTDWSKVPFYPAFFRRISWPVRVQNVCPKMDLLELWIGHLKLICHYALCNYLQLFICSWSPYPAGFSRWQGLFNHQNKKKGKDRIFFLPKRTSPRTKLIPQSRCVKKGG